MGAGLVGSLLAVFLHRRGYAVDVFEKRPDLRVRGGSAGRSINLALAARGMNALEQAGLLELVRPLLIPMRGRMLHEIGKEPEFFAYGQREHEVIYSVSRGLLNNLMVTAAESESAASFHFEHELVDVDLTRCQLEFRAAAGPENRREEFEYLIGADGGGSQVRQEIVEAGPGSFSAEMLDHDYKELEIPAGKDGRHQLDPNALHIWPRGGFMLIALPNLDGSFTVTLFMPSDRQESEQASFADLAGPGDARAFFDEVFPTASRLMPELEQDFAENPTSDLGTIRCDNWVHGNTLILGDAAHAIVPFHGQGMNCGFEDCAKLNQMLDEFDDDWNSAAAAFAESRRPQANAIAEMALENYVVMRDSVSDARFQAKKELGFRLEARWPKRFIPRYSMVMFHDIPYAEAQRRGAIQEAIMEDLLGDGNNADAVDLVQAEQWIQDRLTELELNF